jgi:hypothetical protein
MPEVKIKRSQLAMFLNVGTSVSPEWARVGKGVTGQTVSYNPQTTTETYIHEDSATTSLDSYQVNVSTPQTAYAGETVFDFIDDLRQNRAVGSDAEAEVLLVYLYSSSPYPAELSTAIIQIDDFGGDGGSSVVINYTINLNGDPVAGTCTVADGVPTFTPTSVSAIALSSIVPADAATGISTASTIVLTFNNKIKEESIVATSAAGAIVAVTREWDATGKILTLTPDSALSSSTTYLVAIAGVVDIYGQVLSASVSDFATA